MKPKVLTQLCWLSLACCPTFGATGLAGATPAAEEVLRQALEARGGPAAFSHIHSFQAKGTVSFYTLRGPWWDASGLTNVWSLQILATHSNQFRCVTDLSATAGASSVFVPPRYYEHGYDGQKAWEVPPGRPPQVLEGIFEEERREQAQCFAWCAEPQNYRSLTNLGETVFEGRRCYELKLVRPSGNEETHYYDVTNHLLAGLVRSSVFGPSLEKFVLSDYQVYGGFLFPTRIAYSAEDERYMANLNAVEELKAFDLNSVKPTTEFTLPQASARLESLTDTQPSRFGGSELQNMLRDWVHDDKLAASIVVGWLDAQGRAVVGMGQKTGFGQITPGPSVDGETVYVLCSISKVFTRLLLLDMVQRGEMRLDDPAQQYLPAALRLPSRHGKPITLLHLATHTSGLARYFSGSEEEVYAAVSRYELMRDPGAAYEYSNTGMGLLGKAIERKAGEPFQDLVLKRICQPLGMKHTDVMRCTFPGVDGVRSSANDLLALAAAALGLAPSPSTLGALLGHAYTTHGGGGSGFVTDLILDPGHRRALVLLADHTSSRYGRAEATLQRLILDPACKPAPATAPVALDAAFLGQYLLEDNSVWSVRQEGQRLLLRETGQPSYEVFPLAARQLANRLADLEATFLPGSSGQPERLVLCTPEQHRRLEGTRLPTAAARHEPAGDYSGQYQGPDKRALVIRCAGSRLAAEFNGPNSAEQELQILVPESEGSFHSQGTPAALTFLRDKTGAVTALMLHLYGGHTRYARFAPAPAVDARASDRFLGTWETTVQDGQTSLHVSLSISRTQGAYRAAFSAKEFKDYPFETLVFLSKNSLLLGASFGPVPATFQATLNVAATELSGTWKEGQGSTPVTFKRVSALAPALERSH